MAIKSADQITIYDVTDAYSIMTSSDSWTFMGEEQGVPVGASCSVQIEAYCGPDKCSSVHVDSSAIQCPTGIEAAVSGSGSSTVTVTFTVRSILNSGCSATIPVTVDNVEINKKFSFGIARIGESGNNSYLHIKYSALENPTNASDMSDTPNTYIGVYADFNEPDSTNPSDYTWSRFQGMKGDVGNGINSVSVSYAKSTSLDIPATSSFGTTMPTVGEGEYLWVMTVIDYTDPDKDDTVSYTYTKQGVSGQSGTSITVKSIQYQEGTSATTQPTGSWSNNIVPVAEGKYLWTKTTFSDNKVAYSIARQGSDGADGISYYTHVRYSVSADGSNFVTTSTDNTKYIGIYTGTSSTAPSDKSSYTWSKYKGEDGQSGTSSYTHIKYSANSSGSGMVDTPTATTKYIGIYTGTSSTPPTSATSYKWNKYVGDNGVSSYMYVRYATDASGSNMTSSPSSTTKYIGVYSGNLSTAPTTASSYVWSKYQGEDGTDGVDGVGINSITISYAKSTTLNRPAASAFSSTIPAVGEEEYLWTMSVIDYTDPNKEDTVSYTYARQGKNGTNGNDGTSITVSSIQYQEGTSSTTEPTGNWSNNIVTVGEGKYLWTKTTFSDGGIAYSVARQGANGDDGKSAYRIWLDEGNTGTEADFIASLKGEEGIGIDGKTTYLHIAYANSADGSQDFSVSSSANKKYIGQCTDFNEADPTTYSSYKWTLIKGADGTSYYTHVRYSASSVGTDFVTTPTDTTKYIGIYTGTSASAPSDKSLYKWSKYKGEDGQSGTSSYTHIRYSANSSGSGMVDAPTSATKYIGIYTGTSSTAPTSATSYKWNKYVGDNGVSWYTHIKYSASANGSNMVDSPSSTTKYIGIYTGQSSSAPSTTSSYKWSKYMGEDGSAGKGIKSTSTTYQAHSNGTTEPTGTWEPTPPPTTPEKPYMWTKAVITYTDNNTSTMYSVGATPEGVQANIDAVDAKANDLYARTSTGLIETLSGTWVTSTKAEDGGLAVPTVYGKSEQTQLSGKNLIIDSDVEVSNNNYCVNSYTPVAPLIAGETYTATICVTPAAGVTQYQIYTSQGWENQCRFNVSGTSKQIVSKTFTCSYYSGRTPTDNISYAQLLVYRFPNDGTVTGNSTIHWIQVEKSSTATPYEPYCGGIPSPNPDFPQEIRSLESTKINVAGKNLWDSDEIITRLGTYGWVKNEDGSYYGNIYGWHIYTCSYDKCIRLPNIDERLTISLDFKWDSITSTLFLYVFYEDGSSTYDRITANEGKLSHTTKQGGIVRGFGITYSNNDNITLKNIQVELGTSATAYEPYKGSTATLSDITLRSTPDGTRDRVFKDSDGVWKVERNVKEIALKDKGWGVTAVSTGYCAVGCSGFTDRKHTGNNNAFSNLFESFGNHNAIQNGLKTGLAFNLNEKYKNYCYISLSQTLLSENTKEAFVSWCTENNAVVQYPLATPTYEILPDEIQSQLNLLSTHKDITHVYSDAEMDVDIMTREWADKESLSNDIGRTEDDLTAAIEEEARKVLEEADKRYTTPSQQENAVKSVLTKITETSEGWKATFEDVKDKVDTQGATLETYKRHVVIANGEISINNTENTVNSVFTNQDLRFRHGETDMATFSVDGADVNGIKTNRTKYFGCWSVQEGKEITTGKKNLNDVWIGG